MHLYHTHGVPGDQNKMLELELRIIMSFHLGSSARAPSVLSGYAIFPAFGDFPLNKYIMLCDDRVQKEKHSSSPSKCKPQEYIIPKSLQLANRYNSNIK